MAVVAIIIAVLVDRVFFVETPVSADALEMQPVNSDDKSTDRAADVAVAAPQGAAQALTGSVKNTKAAAVLAMTGLAFQVFVEAVGFGTLNEVDSVAQLASGLLINCCTISLALGSALIKAGFNRRQLLIILTCFTLIAPIGMIIGMAAGSEMPAPVNVVLLALTTGFYLYFALAEVVSKEFKDNSNWMGKTLAMVIGLLIILGLVFIESAHAH
jgi:zinc transporter ZupT